MKRVNSYDLYNETESSTTLYHAIASSVEEVRELAEEAAFDIEGLEIELVKSDVRDQLGRPYAASIKDATIH